MAEQQRRQLCLNNESLLARERPAATRHPFVGLDIDKVGRDAVLSLANREHFVRSFCLVLGVDVQRAQ